MSDLSAVPRPTTLTSTFRVPAGGASLVLETVELSHSVVVRAFGSIDLSTAPRWRDELTAAMATGHHRLVIDLDGCDFIDSTGLGVLASAHRWARQKNRMMIVATEEPKLLRILQLTGLDKVFKIQSSRRSPLESKPVPEQLPRTDER